MPTFHCKELRFCYINGSGDTSDLDILNGLTSKNLNRVLIGYLNINSLRNKFEILVSSIAVNLDILMISETKLDESFPVSQFFRSGFENPIRLDRSSSGGGITLYTREGIPFKSLKSNCLSANTEAFLVEVKINKKKWLLCYSYNPHKALIENHINVLRKALGIYLHKYDHILLIGDFILEINEISSMISVMSIIQKVYQTQLPVLKIQRNHPVMTFC